MNKIKQKILEVDTEQLYICKPCGYVMKEHELGDVCPACGLPRKVIVEHKERMSPLRNKFLNLDAHPIAVHFPQTLLVLILVGLIANLILPNFFSEEVLGSARVAAILFPFTVFAAAISGMADGKMRFKSVKTPILKKKIMWSLIMSATSVGVFIIALNPIDSLTSKIIMAVLTIIAMYCGISLGHKGKRLMNIGMGGAVKIFGKTI